MKKKLIFLGCASLVVYALMACMAWGVGASMASVVRSIVPAFAHPVIGRWETGFSRFYEVPNSAAPIGSFLTLLASAFILYAAAIRAVVATKDRADCLNLVLGFGILFRIILYPTPLILENDLYRYLWEGKVTAAGISPYRLAPIEAACDPCGDAVGRKMSALRTQSAQSEIVFERIGRKDVPAVYPPLSMGLFALSATFRADSELAIKALILCFDIGAMFVIVAILRAMNRRPAALLIYAWSPLIVKEFANSGHLDAIGIFFLLTAFLFWIRRRRLSMAAGWTCAVLSKYFPIALIPIFWRRMGFAGLCSAVIVGALSFVPFIRMDSSGGISSFANTFSGFVTFGREWEFNAGLFRIFEFAVGSQPAKWIGVALILALMVLSARNKFETPRAASRSVLILFFTALALSPVVNPWYATWLVPFLCFTLSPALLVFTAAVTVSYAGFIESREILWLTAIEWGIVFTLLVKEIRRWAVIPRDSPRSI